MEYKYKMKYGYTFGNQNIWYFLNTELVKILICFYVFRIPDRFYFIPVVVSLSDLWVLICVDKFKIVQNKDNFIAIGFIKSEIPVSNFKLYKWMWISYGY